MKVFPPKIGLGARIHDNLKVIRQVRTLHKEVAKTAQAQNINSEEVSNS